MPPTTYQIDGLPLNDEPLLRLAALRARMRDGEFDLTGHGFFLRVDAVWITPDGRVSFMNIEGSVRLSHHLCWLARQPSRINGLPGTNDPARRVAILLRRLDGVNGSQTFDLTGRGHRVPAAQVWIDFDGNAAPFKLSGGWPLEDHIEWLIAKDQRRPGKAEERARSTREFLATMAAATPRPGICSRDPLPRL